MQPTATNVLKQFTRCKMKTPNDQNDLKEILKECIRIIKEQEAQHTKKNNLKKEIRDLLSGVDL
jgi:hypothetical protein